MQYRILDKGIDLEASMEKFLIKLFMIVINCSKNYRYRAKLIKQYLDYYYNYN